MPDGIRRDAPFSYASILDGLGEAYIGLATGGGRFLWLDFRNGPQRLPGDRRHFDALMLDSLIFHTNMVDASGNEVAGGLRTPRGRSVERVATEDRVQLAESVGESTAWAVRFNPVDFPGPTTSR